ncbi:MAG: response regulator transcription factor [Bacillati bacterium ANGP1]|uniref:Response regulator transcription factor n=1 Tax=Candidatus Segetimicrobium genomatis TaxID=2569760 RepID=A0A537K7K1_9BACT|nr:MAG: response regulator transcription factor [Terrabacteria group bacterium ANGP1]
MSEEQTVLVVDDDHRLVSLVRMYLEREGFGVFAAYDGQDAMDLYARHRPGFVILDLLLPKIDGVTVCRQIRKTSNVPILMLTAKVEEVDKLVGLSVGADDYVTKPFSPRELVARVRAILRRAAPATPVVPRLAHADLVMDLERHEVAADGREVRLTPIEFKLLQALMEFPGRVFTRDQLLAHVYAFDEAVVVDRTVDVHIGKLREKLGDDPARPRYIQTVRGVGYKLVGSGRAG